MERKVTLQDLQLPPVILDQFNQLTRLDQLKLDQLFPLGLDDESVDEASIHVSARSFLYHKFRQFFIDNIPVELVKQLPSCWKFALGICCYGFALLIFIYFCLNNYDSNVNNQYISLDSSIGSCETVPIPVTGTYYADDSGNWEGTAAFSYYQSSYSFNYNNFVAQDFSTYQAMMAVFYRSFAFFGEKAKFNNLAINLVLWMTYVRFYSTEYPLIIDFSKVGRGNLQYAQLSGDPTVVFNTKYSGLALGSSKGICEIPALVDYDEANGNFKATMTQESILNETTCSAVTQPFIYQKNINLDPYFSINLDIRSLSIALGINLKFNNIRNLMPASDKLPQVTLGTTIYTVGTYFDIRYPEMASIFCVYNETVLSPTAPQITQLCLVSSGSSVFLPVFNHMGTNLKIPTYCDCEKGTGKSKQCNYFFLMAGLIAFDAIVNTSSIQVSLTRALTLLAKHNSNYEQLNRAAFNASASSVFYALNTADSSIKTSQYISNAYNFCRLDANTVCSLITFYTLDQDNSVTKFHYPLTNGSCEDTITPLASSWSNLANNPPTALTQIYYKCRSSTIDALINAVGVASGNTSIAMLVLLFISVPLVFGFMAFCRVIPKEQEYREKEKTIVLDTLATVLLRIRDKHYEAIDPRGTAANLTEELILAANFSRYEVQMKKDDKTDPINGTEARSSKSFKLMREASKQKSFRNFQQKREFLGTELLYRALPGHSSRLNLSPQKSLQLRGIPYSRLGSVNNEATLNQLENGDYGRNSFEVGSNHDDITQNNYPTEDEQVEQFFHVKVMNDPEDKKEYEYQGDDPSWLVPYHENQLEPVIQGISYYFAVSLQNQTRREKDKDRANNDLPLHQRDRDFSRGNILAHRLVQMDGKQLIDQNDPALFVGLANALGMHASLTLGVEMKTIAREYSDRVGYQIGDKIFTYSTLVAFSLLNPVTSSANQEIPL